METITRKVPAVPSIFINKTEVNSRIQNYLQHKHGLLSTAIGKPDSTSAWYSAEQFEEIVKEMHLQDASGIRVYFGAYDSNDELFANQLTVIFVPTFRNETTGNHRDIVIEDPVDRDGRWGLPKYLDTIALCPPMCAGHELEYPINDPE
jgi:hypothetical protein